MMIVTQAWPLVAIAAVMLPGMAVGQKRVELVTVCEVLTNPQKYSGKPIGILGRLDCTDIIIDNHCYIVEDRCERPFKSSGHIWPNKIWLEFRFPATPKTNFEMDGAKFEHKLSLVRQSTSLGLHEVMSLKIKDGVVVPVGWRNEKDEWGIGYGRLLIRRTVNFFGAPMGLKINPKDLRSVKDEEYPK